MRLETLYKKASNGALLFWAVKVIGNGIRTQHGQIGGVVQESLEAITKGKNIGRSNETTPEEQAEKEAKSRWEKKLKTDYVLDMNKAGESSDLVLGGILPMLAHSYDKQKKKIQFPCYVQPKLDGHRCLAVVDADGKCALWSRTRKPIFSMPHIINAIEATGIKNVTLDGELYNPEYADRFEELTSLIRHSTPKEGHKIVQYHVYDVVQDATFQDRLVWLDEWDRYNPGIGSSPLRVVETLIANDNAQLWRYHKVYTLQGYEGAIARNTSGKYKHGRSYDLQKVKLMQDAEYIIQDVVEGRGKLKGHGIFVCQLANTCRSFHVKMKGPLPDLKKYWEKPQDYEGRMLTVQYFSLTRYGKPRFPVGLRIREDV